MLLRSPQPKHRARRYRAQARRMEMNDQEREQFRAVRREAGLKIDPETAEVAWIYAQTADPYGIEPELPEEYWQVGREYFARSPGSDVWVSFDDLPDATRDALWRKHESRLMFPAGLLQGVVGPL